MTMHDNHPSQERHDPRLDRVLAEYLEALEQGQPAAADVWIERYPDLAAELREFISGHEHIAGMVAPGVTLAASDAPLNSGPSTTLRYFGEYELLHEIARGGMGVVYKARQTTLKRIVALKMILAGQLAGAEDVQRFHAEAEAAARLQHPNIVPIFEIGQHEGHHYFSMAYVDGQSLAHRIVSGPLPPRDAAALLTKVADAVTYAHVEGVVHRDLKPANVLLDQHGEPHITDFGLAKRLSPESLAADEVTAGLTATGQVLGTPSYMPPEQAAGKTDQIGPLSDVYSLGATLYCLLTGRPPFQAASPLDTLLQVLQKEPLSVRQLVPEVPRDLETVCMKCLEKEPRRRYASARELADDLKRYLNGEPVKARPISRPARAVRWCGRNRVIASLTGTAAGLLLLVALVSSAGYLTTSAALDQSQRNLYVAHIYLARQALNVSQDGPAVELLDQYIPPPRQPDLRGWEWDYLRSQGRISLSVRGKHGQRNAAWSSNGQRLAYYHEGAVRILDVASGREVLTLRGHDSRWLAWSPDNAQLASAGYVDNSSWPGAKPEVRINVWDPAAGKLLHELRQDSTPTGFYQQYLSWSPDGMRLAWSGGDKAARIWDVAAEKQVLSLAGHEPPWFNSVVWSPSGELLATATNGPQEAGIWDATSGELIHKLPRSEAVAWSPDGKQLASGSKVWDVATWKELRSLDIAGQGSWNAVAWSRDGQRIAASFLGEQVTVFDAATGKALLTLHGGGATALDWMPDNRRLLALTNAGRLHVWDTAVDRAGDLTIDAHASTVFSVSWSSDSRQVASASYDQTIKIWDAATGQHVRTLTFDGPVYKAAWSRDGRWMALIDANFTLRIVDAASGALVQTLQPQNGNPQGIEFSRDGRWLAAGGTVWDASTWAEVFRLVEPQSGDWQTWSPDSRRLAISGVNHEVKLWQVGGGGKTWGAKESGIRGMPIAWSSDGRWLATGDQHDIQLWHAPGTAMPRLSQPQPHSQLRGHSRQIMSLAWHPRGDRLVSASLDDSVRVWDPRTAQEVLSFRGRSSSGFRDARFSPDGQRLAAASVDGTLTIWTARAAGNMLDYAGPSNIVAKDLP